MKFFIVTGLLLSTLTSFGQNAGTGPGNGVGNESSISKSFSNPKFKHIDYDGSVAFKSVISCDSDADAVCQSLGKTRSVDVKCKMKRLDKPIQSAFFDGVQSLQESIFCFGYEESRCALPREVGTLKPAVNINERGEDRFLSRNKAEIITKIVCE